MIIGGEKMNKENTSEESRKNILPLSVIKTIFKKRAERRKELKNVAVMRTSKPAIQKLEMLIVSYIERLTDQIMDITAHSGLNTVYPKHVTFYENNMKNNEN